MTATSIRPASPDAAHLAAGPILANDRAPDPQALLETALMDLEHAVRSRDPAAVHERAEALQQALLPAMRAAVDASGPPREQLRTALARASLRLSSTRALLQRASASLDRALLPLWNDPLPPGAGYGLRGEAIGLPPRSVRGLDC